MNRPSHCFFWKRLDTPGSDSCRLFKLSNGWRLWGSAAFYDDKKSCCLEYEVITDKKWKTKSGAVSGFIGKKNISIVIKALNSGHWKINGILQPKIHGCIDLDLGFTPATNLIVLRRLRLKHGERQEAPAAYLAFPAMRMVVLPQIYRRIGSTSYQYDSPTADYSGVLEVAPSGMIIDYPGIFAGIS